MMPHNDHSQDKYDVLQQPQTKFFRNKEQRQKILQI